MKALILIAAASLAVSLAACHDDNPPQNAVVYCADGSPVPDNGVCSQPQRDNDTPTNEEGTQKP